MCLPLISVQAKYICIRSSCTWDAHKSEEYSIWISPQLLVQRHQCPLLCFPSLFVPTRDAEGPGKCGPGDFIP